MRIFFWSIWGFGLCAAAYNMAEVKTEQENQQILREIEKIGNAIKSRNDTQPQLFSQEWRKIVRDADAYARSKSMPAFKKYSPVIIEIGNNITVSRGVKGSQKNAKLSSASDMARAFKEAARKEIRAMKKSPFTFKEKRWAVDRYAALLEALEKIANEFLAQSNKSSEYQPMPSMQQKKKTQQKESEYGPLPNPSEPYSPPTAEELADIDLSENMY